MIKGPSYSSEPSPDLPAERVSEDPLFSQTRVNFTGPLYVNSSIEHSEKTFVYICLKTCGAFGIHS